MMPAASGASSRTRRAAARACAAGGVPAMMARWPAGGATRLSGRRG